MNENNLVKDTCNNERFMDTLKFIVNVLPINPKCGGSHVPQGEKKEYFIIICNVILSR